MGGSGGKERDWTDVGDICLGVGLREGARHREEGQEGDAQDLRHGFLIAAYCVFALMEKGVELGLW